MRLISCRQPKPGDTYANVFTCCGKVEQYEIDAVIAELTTRQVMDHAKRFGPDWGGFTHEIQILIDATNYGHVALDVRGGWDESNQRWVRKHPFCGLKDTCQNPVSPNGDIPKM